MGFDDEWAQLRSEAATRHDTSMRLNQLPPADGGGGGSAGGAGKLVSTPQEKTAAANSIKNAIVPHTKKATGWADEATSKATSALRDWQTGAALKTVQTTWDKQVKTLLGRLNSEEMKLRATNRILGGVDQGRRLQIQSVPSNFDSY
ncbi:hypothetical protein AB0E74_14710 [Streptomyces sp. NPDC030392]|uniref:hypothetical protein n=1 Tax=Streptomyces sp. NPDC030392 TaxID=3155468 RepID=UPI0033EB675D